MLRVCMEVYLASERDEVEIVIDGRVLAQACEGDVVVSEREYRLFFTSSIPDEFDRAEQTIEVLAGAETILFCRGEFDENFGETLTPETRYRFDLFLTVIAQYIELPAVREGVDSKAGQSFTVELGTESCSKEEHLFLGRLWHGAPQ